MVLQDVVVGLDGSDGSADALRWAWGLAEDLSASLRALSTWTMPVEPAMAPVISAFPSQAYLANHCSEMIDKTLAQAGIESITSEVREGDAGAILARESGVADLIVVGRTGDGHRGLVTRLTEMVLGSTARYLIHHAKGPIAAVPAQQVWITDPSVVVGIDQSPASVEALRWAVEHLPPTAKIHAVRAVPPYVEGLLPFDHSVLDRILETADQELDHAIKQAVAPLGADAANRVQPLVLVEPPRYALMEPGFDVDLIVVGERHRGPIAARMLGSISDHVVRYAPCPVVVVPAKEETES